MIIDFCLWHVFLQDYSRNTMLISSFPWGVYLNNRNIYLLPKSLLTSKQSFSFHLMQDDLISTLYIFMYFFFYFQSSIVILILGKLESSGSAILLLYNYLRHFQAPVEREIVFCYFYILNVDKFRLQFMKKFKLNQLWLNLHQPHGVEGWDTFAYPINV